MELKFELSFWKPKKGSNIRYKKQLMLAYCHWNYKIAKKHKKIMNLMNKYIRESARLSSGAIKSLN